MTAYLGNPGSLVRVECPSVQSKDSQRPARYLNTIGGTTFAQVGPRSHRSWDVRLPRISTPAEVATWQAFVEGEFGYGPWWFIPEMAATTNVISPRGSVLDATLPLQSGTSLAGPPLVLPDGRRSGRSLLLESTSMTAVLPWVGGYEYTPVISGFPVSASVWVRGPEPRLRLRFYDEGFSIVSTISVSGVAGSGVLSLSGVMVPSGAVSALLLVDGAQFVARPAITWTEDVRSWSVGAGAPKVHIAGISEDVTLAVPGREMVGASLTVREVG